MAETDMVEKVAKAISDADFVLSVKRAREEDTGDEYEALARAAIEAMREPTDAMGLGLPKDYRAGSHSAAQIWQAMIDAALSDTRDKG